MTKTENECANCPREQGCLGTNCPNRNVEHIVCDGCGTEDEDLYEYNGEILCADCILSGLKRVQKW